MQNTHFIHFAEQRVEQVADIIVEKRDHLKDMPGFVKNGGELYVGMELILERGMRAPLDYYGFLLDWHIGEAVMDLTGFGKFPNSTCMVYNYQTRNVEKWPFTMLYIK